MAWTVSFALLGALLYSMLIAPVLASFIFGQDTREWHNPLMTAITAGYRRSVQWAIRLRWVTVGVALCALAASWLLVSSGVGSYASRAVIRDSAARWRAVLAGVAILIGLLALDVAVLLPKGITLPLPWKIAVTVALIFPAGFLMGMPFPIGLARLEKWQSSSVRWAWSLNAAASVLGSVAALVFAIYLGLVQTLLIGGLLYLVALAIVARDPARLLQTPLHLS